MTFLEAYDALSSDDPATREQCAAMLLTTHRWLMDRGEIEAVTAIYHAAWEAVHEVKEAAE